ncbi:MAG: tyrosine--tRNA ligase [Anaerolineaceae bacterium]
MVKNAFEELKWRGLVFDAVDGVEALLDSKKITLYNGFDASADSLHIGHLVPLIALARLQRFGHTPIALAGGGTGMIGDPSGKSAERQLLTRAQVDENVAGIKKQLAQFLDFEVKSNPAKVLNNADWLDNLTLIEFLRDIGKNFTVNYMMAKDSVKNRIDREEGISYTEFSYMLLQSYDFLHLFQTENCVMQTGGSDQWGNITAGVELIRRMTAQSVYGMVYPLITKADGTKFGKTESGTVWLDPNRTSPYRFYQFWLNTDDRDVINYLKIFTFLSLEQIEELAAKVTENPELREAQRVLAREMTSTVHGITALERAESAAQVLFGGEISGLSAAEIEDVFSEVPSSELAKDNIAGDGIAITDLLLDAGVAPSKGDARRQISQGGIYLNNHRISDPMQSVTLEDVIEGKYLVLRKGRKSYFLVKVIG